MVSDSSVHTTAASLQPVTGGQGLGTRAGPSVRLQGRRGVTFPLLCCPAACSRAPATCLGSVPRTGRQCPGHIPLRLVLAAMLLASIDNQQHTALDLQHLCAKCPSARKPLEPALPIAKRHIVVGTAHVAAVALQPANAVEGPHARDVRQHRRPPRLISAALSMPDHCVCADMQTADIMKPSRWCHDGNIWVYMHQHCSTSSLYV